MRSVSAVRYKDMRYKNWLARQDSNLQSTVPKTGALPLGHAPARFEALAPLAYGLSRGNLPQFARMPV